MCGIVGYTGKKEVFEILINGLKKLEYRGYDSAGLALQDVGQLQVAKAAGSIANLEKQTRGTFKPATVGIGHTRWATHGRPTDENAHPHLSCCENFALVHNGIIENHEALRTKLREEGHRFRSQTDTEVLAHLVEELYDGELLEAVRQVAEQVEGSYAMVVVSAKEPGRLVCARKDSPLVIGLGEGENFIASDITALLAHTRRTYILENGEFASITAGGVEISDARGRVIDKQVFEVKWDSVAAEKGGYDHFMLKEIMEQPTAVRETLRQRLDLSAGKVNLSELGFCSEDICALDKIFIVACGTAYHASLVGKFAIEKLVGLPVEVDLASEFRYRDPLLVKDKHLVIVVSQSGETADTLAALRLAKNKGVKVLAVTNVVGSSVSREADEVLFTWAGPEVAVASTKAYLTQLIALYLITLYLGDIRGVMDPGLTAELVQGLLNLPALLGRILAAERLEELRAYAVRLARWEDAFFLGRNLDYAVAMEGSLKLKEISYIHAEAYAAGELKHGTLALITEGIPVIVLATQGAVLEKTLSNVQEVNARGGSVLAITKEEYKDVAKQVDTIFYLPAVNDLLAPVLTAVPLQLIAYYTAVARDCSVDKPRNLAKSVTVE